VQKIQDIYEKRRALTGIRISFKGRIVEQSTLVKSLLLPNDDLVVFTAVDLLNGTVQHQEFSSCKEADTASQHEENAPGGPVTQTANNNPGLETMGRESPPEDAETTLNPCQNASGHLANQYTPSFVPPLTPWYASTSSSHALAQDPDRHPPCHQPRSPAMHSVQDQSHQLSQRSSKELNAPPVSVEALRETSPPPITASVMEGETPADHHERTKERSMTPSNNVKGTPDHSAVQDETQFPVPPRSTSFSQNADAEPESSFDPEKIFNREASPEYDIQEELGSVDRCIRSTIDLQNPDVLEAGVSTSLKVLGRLKEKFSQCSASNTDAASWVQAIDALIPQAQRKRTVVGVVGNTGAGKSSVINAMLDEERLVPTNCMRACTAVVTEISWNSSTDLASKYCAEIEFISQADWEKELTVLLREFISENGTLSREAQDPNSDAGIAWAKFHSVYPSVAKDALGGCTIPSLMSKTFVVNVLGTTKKIRAARPQHFYQELQRYVDSKEKVAKKDKNKEKVSKSASQTEYWPLIKVVKIYTKSHALSTGAVIVDLPGVQDSNAARAAVAQGYMKQCNSLWIVAPITRAVDDKAAKTLLGDSFKRQLKYDGGFSSVTFICSKTDDISITEAIDSLGLEEESTAFEEQLDRHDEQIEQIRSKIADLNKSREVYKLAISSANKEIDVWESLQEQLDKGSDVFAPLPKSRKRKKAGSNKQSRKKKQVFDNDTDDAFQDSDDEESESDDEVTSHAEGTRLSEMDIREKLKVLRMADKNARRELTAVKHSMDNLKFQIQELEEKKEQVKVEISRICIAGRNRYSKSAIQQDFAAGIKEIDQENAAEEDEENFNPDVEMRDYDEVARLLPVFCVSSRAYQKMCGRMQKDDGVPGFVTPEETEVPQLQDHCKKLTEGGRIQTSRTFLTSVCQMLTTFNLWMANDGTSLKMTDEDMRKQVIHLKRRLSELTDGLDAAIRACIREIRSEMKSQIFDKCPELISEAIESAPATAHAWGQKDQGGLVYQSYKAVVLRNGVYQSRAAGHRDFNSDLVDPIVKRLAAGWERAFQARLPKAFDTYIGNSSKLLHKFHEAIEERGKTSGVGLANLSILKTQVSNYEQLFKDLGPTLIAQMNELQREANRDFTPCVANIMHTVYGVCSQESGQGCYKRMKEHMENHVKQERYRMFDEAIRTVIKHLDGMCKALQESMKMKAYEIFMQMNRDYTQVLGGATSDQPVSLQSEEERQLRSDIRQILEGVDALFEPILNGDIALEEGPTNGTSGQAEEQNDVDVEDGRAIFDSQHDFHEDDADNPVATQATSYEPEQRNEMDLDDGEPVDDGESYQEQI
jgi:GTPase SAR1 family protein